MPITVNKFEIELVAAPAAITLPTTDPYDLYTIVSTGSVTIGGVTSINASGALTEGLTYVFQYTATITGGSVTIMGDTVPSDYLQKDFYAEAYYNGATWEVVYFPNMDQTGFISPSALTIQTGGHVSAVNLNVATAAVAGEQLLGTRTIPPNTEESETGFNPALKITAWGLLDVAAAPKNIHLKVVTGANTNTLFYNTVYNNWGRFFKLEAIITTTAPGVFQVDSILHGGAQYPEVFLNSGINYDYTVNQVVQFWAEEVTPAGGLVTLKNMRVEKIV